MMYLEYQHFATSKEIMSLGQWFSNGAILPFRGYLTSETILVVTTGEEALKASSE